MNAVTFDTHQLIRELRKTVRKTVREADLTEKQAEAVVRIISRSQENLVSREHFDLKVEVLRTEMNGKFTLLQWMLAAFIAIAIANFVKQFF